MDYADTYSRFPLPKLIDVLDKPEEYHAEAVAAARRELFTRSITEEEITRVLHERATERQRLAEKRLSKQRNRLTLHPRPDLLDTSLSAADQLSRKGKWSVRIVAALISIASVISIVTVIPYLTDSVTGEFAWEPLFLIQALGFPLLVLAGGLLLSAFRRSGWYIVTANISFNIAAQLLLAGTILLKDAFGGYDLDGLILSLEYSPNMLYLAGIYFVINAGFLIALLRAEVRRHLRIDPTAAVVAITAGCGVSVITYLL